MRKREGGGKGKEESNFKMSSPDFTEFFFLVNHEGRKLRREVGE